MIRMPRNAAETPRLEQAVRAATDRTLRDRRHGVRRAHRGRRRPDMADERGLSTRSVQRWLHAYLERGPAGLAPRPPPGAKPKMPAHLADERRRWGIAGPAPQGLDRANWTHPEGADHWDRTHGLRTSRAAVQRLCHQLDLRRARPTSR